MAEVETKVKESLDRLSQAVDTYSPIAVFGLFSGGHDSLTATHIAAQHPAFTAAVHINTGIGIEETRAFVRETCLALEWPLKEYRAKEDCGQDYRELCLRYGFPGPPAHSKMYIRLKERALDLCIRTTKTKRSDRVILVTGARSQESARRMGHVLPLKKDGASIWLNIIHDWSKLDCNRYIDSRQLNRNRVVDLIHMSGECLCGAFAHPGELKEIEFWFPETAAQIRQLEIEVKAAGHKYSWEDRPPCARPRFVSERQMPLCYDCVTTGRSALNE